MQNEVQVTIRIPSDIAARAKALVDELKEHPEFMAFRMTRAAILRMAMIQGIQALEKKYLAGDRE